MGNMIFNRRLGTAGEPDDKPYDFDNYKDSSSKEVYEPDLNYEYRVFPEHRYGGPKGLGDPTYRGLSKMEEDPLIPQRMRDISRTQLCIDEVDKFSECAKREGFKMVLTCRDTRDLMVKCQMDWFNKAEFREMVKEEYLNERSHYRETGFKQRRYMRGNFIKRDIVNDPPVDKDGNYRPQKPGNWDSSYPDGPPKWANFDYSKQ